MGKLQDYIKKVRERKALAKFEAEVEELQADAEDSYREGVISGNLLKETNREIDRFLLD